MQITVFKRNTVSECEACGLLISVPNEGTRKVLGLDVEEMGDISTAYHDHLKDSQGCRAWHDNLPTIADLHRAFRESSGNRSD